MKGIFASVFLAVTFAGNCTNIGLLDQLENPAGGLTLTAFVASVNSTGDLSAYSAGLFASCGGVQGLLRADCACQNMAANAGLPESGKYIAFMSAAAYDMSCRIIGNTSQLLNCPIPSGGPNWATTTGQKIAKGYAGLLSGTLLNPLNITEYKSAPASASFVWTGTQPGGQFFSNLSTNCGDFTTGSVNNSVVGDFDSASSTWINTGSVQSCTISTGTMYCLARL
jgi:hypothetical protein